MNFNRTSFIQRYCLLTCICHYEMCSPCAKMPGLTMIGGNVKNIRRMVYEHDTTHTGDELTKKYNTAIESIIE